MVDATRALLDELMGRERNVPLGERSNRRLRYDDPAVCKYDIAGLCPHGLFKNTRSDLGPCEFEVHNDHLDWQEIQADYNQQDDKEKERYEKKLLRYLDDLIREMDRKIAKSKDRAEKESALKPIKAEDQMKLDMLQQQAKDSLEKSQRLGENGDVDAALMLSQQAETHKKNYDELFRRLTVPERTMTVCDICGVFINSTDNEERRWDHLNGKQFLGWKAIREHYAKLQEKFTPAGRGGSAPPGSERAEARSRERDGERDRERSPRREEPSRRDDRRHRDDRYRDERHRDGRGYERGYDRGYDRAGHDRGYGGGGYNQGYDGRGYRGSGGGSRGSSYRSSGQDGYPEERRRY